MNRWKVSSRIWWSDERVRRSRSYTHLAERASASREKAGVAGPRSVARPDVRRGGLSTPRRRRAGLERRLSHRLGARPRDRCAASALAARRTRRGFRALLRGFPRTRRMDAARPGGGIVVRRDDRDDAFEKSYGRKGDQRSRVFTRRLAGVAGQQREPGREACDQRYGVDDGGADAGGRGRADPLEGAAVRGGGAVVIR